MKRFVQLCEVREHHSRYLPTCIHFTRWRKQFARARTPLSDVWTLRIVRCKRVCVSCSCQRAQNAVRFIVKSCLRKQGKNIHIQSRAYTFHLKWNDFFFLSTTLIFVRRVLLARAHTHTHIQCVCVCRCLMHRQCRHLSFTNINKRMQTDTRESVCSPARSRILFISLRAV